MAEFTSKATGNWSSSGQTTWNEVGVPGTGDTVLINNDHIITVDVDTTVGASTGTKPGIEIAGASAGSYGTLQLAAGVTLTVSGVNITTYPAILVNRYAWLKVNTAGAKLSVNCTSDWQTCIVNKGHFLSLGTSAANPNAYLSIPSANIKYDNLSTAKVISAATQYRWWDYQKRFRCIKLYSGTNPDIGPISNSTLDGIASFGNTSLVISGASPTWTNEVATYAAITNEGDYWVDYPKGVVFWKSTSSTLTVTYQFNYATWFSSGIISTDNTSGSSLTIDNSTIDHWGSVSTVDTEYTGGAVVARYKYAPSLSSDRAFSFTGNTVNYCSHVLTVYNSTSDAANLVPITGNSFIACRYSGTTVGNSNGLLNVGYTGYIDFSHSTLDSFTFLFSNNYNRNSTPGMNVTYNSGNIAGELLPKTCAQRVAGSTASHNTLTLYGVHAGNIANIRWGGSAGNRNVYTDNILTGSIGAWLQSHITMARNAFVQCPYEAISLDTGTSYTPYYNDITIENNTINNSYSVSYPATDEAGGIILGTRYSAWVDNVTVANNTLNDSSIGIVFHRMEGTPYSAILHTRVKVINNIIANSYCGIYKPPDAGTYVTKLALSRCDYNIEYNPLYGGAVTNVAPATFLKAGVEYNTNTRNVAGVYLMTPNYTLPQSTPRTLALTVSGTLGTDLALNLAWGGGVAQNLALFQGTATGTQTTTALQDTSKSWTTNALSGNQVIIYDVTNGYQYAMIASNTSNTLTLIANRDGISAGGAALAAAPINGTSVYVVISSENTLPDTGSGTVKAGIYSPELVLTSQSDTGITIVSNKQTANPNFTSYYDLSITAGSSCIDTGTSIDAPTTDIIGTARPKGSGYDIGAYEYIPPVTPSGHRVNRTSILRISTSWQKSKLGKTPPIRRFRSRR